MVSGIEERLSFSIQRPIYVPTSFTALAAGRSPEEPREITPLGQKARIGRA